MAHGAMGTKYAAPGGNVLGGSVGVLDIAFLRGQQQSEPEGE